MPEHQSLHIPTQFLTVPLVVFAVHAEIERLEETFLSLSDSRSILPELHAKSLGGEVQCLRKKKPARFIERAVTKISLSSMNRSSKLPTTHPGSSTSRLRMCWSERRNRARSPGPADCR